MKLLVITNNPNRASFRQRIEVYLPFLQDSGIECTWVVYPRGNLARWRLLSRCSAFDVVLLHKKILNVFDAFWFKRCAKKVIFNFDDAVMYDDRHPDRKPSRRKHTKPFERTVELADMVIAGNTYLAEHARQFNDNVEVLPTGLCLAEYDSATRHEKDDRIRLVWIGSRDTLKYLAAVRPALEETGLRFDNVVLRIVCDDFFDLQNMPVEKCRWSLATQAADLVNSDIGLAPLPDNRFTRGKCGFKILQYQAASLPVVASPVGVGSEFVQHGISGYMAANESEWVESISRLISDSELRKRMGRQGRRHVCDFDTGVLGERLVEMIKKAAT